MFLARVKFPLLNLGQNSIATIDTVGAHLIREEIGMHSSLIHADCLEDC